MGVGGGTITQSLFLIIFRPSRLCDLRVAESRFSVLVSSWSAGKAPQHVALGGIDLIAQLLGNPAGVERREEQFPAKSVIFARYGSWPTCSVVAPLPKRSDCGSDAPSSEVFSSSGLPCAVLCNSQTNSHCFI